MSGPVVVLVGAPGAGKTSVGAVLARRRGAVHLDTDAMVERAAGMEVGDIFVNHGEETFRELERRAVAEALAADGAVVSTGGGSIMDAGARDLMSGLPVVWLTVGVGAAAPRVGLDAPRPLLLVQPRAAWRSLLSAREPFYAEVAAHRVPTDDVDVEQVALRVEEVLGWAS